VGGKSCTSLRVSSFLKQSPIVSSSCRVTGFSWLTELLLYIDFQYSCHRVQVSHLALFLAVLRNRSRNWNRNCRNRIIWPKKNRNRNRILALGSGSGFSSGSGYGSCCTKNIKLNLVWQDTGWHMHEAGERRNKNHGNRQEFLL
jgi:hypothetical protein